MLALLVSSRSFRGSELWASLGICRSFLSFGRLAIAYKSSTTFPWIGLKEQLRHFSRMPGWFVTLLSARPLL